MALSVTRTPIKLSSLGAGSTVRESDMGGLDSSAGFSLLAACRTSSPKARKNRESGSNPAHHNALSQTVSWRGGVEAPIWFLSVLVIPCRFHFYVCVVGKHSAKSERGGCRFGTP